MIKKIIAFIIVFSVAIFSLAPLVHAERKSKWTPLFSRKSENIERSKRGETTYASSSQKTPYEEYYLMIRGEIYDMVSRERPLGLKGEVELEFGLDRNGFITKGPIVLNKPDLRLVRAAVNCVKKIVPFPSFPEGLDKEEIEFYVVVRYE